MTEVNQKQKDPYIVLLKYFLDEFDNDLLFGKRDPSNGQEKITLEVFNRLNDIYSVLDRLKRYKLYFEKFYPPTPEITEAEAIEYHLHSRMQDIYSLKEKITRLISFVKHKVEYFDVENATEVKGALDRFKDSIESGLKRANNIRHGHVHDMSVRDLEVSKAKALKQMTEFPEIDQETVDKKYIELIEAAKNKYVSQSSNNNAELEKMKKHFVARLGYIIAGLYRHDQSRFEEMFATD